MWGLLATAQRGTAQPGYYPPNYSGATWTGHLAASDDPTGQITLRHVSSRGEEIFTGILLPDVGIRGKEGALRPSQIALGTRLVAYYIANAKDFNLSPFRNFMAFGFQSSQGTMTPPTNPFNLIFLLEILPDDGQTFTGTVTAVSEASRELSLQDDEGSRGFTGTLIEGYRVKRKDGSFVKLPLSVIPTGTRISVYYVEEERKVEGRKVRTNRIFRIRFLTDQRD